MPITEYEVGKKYHVIMDDCCIGGEFTSILKEMIEYSDTVPPEGKKVTKSNDDEYPELIFENGVKLKRHWGCNIVTVEE